MGGNQRFKYNIVSMSYIGNSIAVLWYLFEIFLLCETMHVDDFEI